MDIQAFLNDSEGLQVINEENFHKQDSDCRFQSENIFGLEYKENMFEEPCLFSTDLPKQEPVEEIFSQIDDSCPSEQTAASPILPVVLQHPPCRCYRINCQKKYCECFRNGRKCSKLCICIDCHNQPIATRMKVNVEQFWQVSYMFSNMLRKC